MKVHKIVGNRKVAVFLCSIFCLVLCLGCVGKTYVVGSIIQDVVDASQEHGNLSVIQRGTPAYLMLIDGLIYANPDNTRLLLAGAEAYSTYSMMVEEEDEKSSLLTKAKGYAFSALEKHKAYVSCKNCPLAEFAECIHSSFRKKDVPLLYWSAVTWGNWISVNLDSVEAIAGIPRVGVLIRRVIELDETYNYGSAYVFLGVYESAKPDGRLQKAKEYFEKGIALGHDTFLMAYVQYALGYSVKIQDRESFRSILNKVLEKSQEDVPSPVLINTIARTRAQELLDNEQEYFFE